LRDVLRADVVRDFVLCDFELGCALVGLAAWLPALLGAGLGAGFPFAGEFWSVCEKASADTNSIVPATPAAFFDQHFDDLMESSIPLENRAVCFQPAWSLSDLEPRQSIRPTALAWEMIPESGSQCQSPLGDGPVTEVYLQ
jgi:hypothetical protein